MRPQIRYRLRRDSKELGDHLLAAAALVRGVAGQGAKQRRAKRVDVGRNGRCGTLQYFGCGECRRTGDHSRRGLEAPGDPRDTEVGQLWFAVIGQQDVRGLHVAMQRANAVRGVECARQLDANAQCLAPIQRSVPADQRLERILGVVRHHDERPAGRRRTDLEDLHDVRVTGQAAHRALLAHEAVEIVRIEVGRQDLDGDLSVQDRLYAAVDDAEAAVADFGDIVESGVA